MRKNNCYITIAVVLFLSILKTHAQDSIAAFRLSGVRLLESPFKRACQTDLNYILPLDPDRLLAPFYEKPDLSQRRKAMGTGKIQGLTDISVDTICRRFPISMPLHMMLKRDGG